MDRTPTKPKAPEEPLRLPTPKVYLSEAEVLSMLGWSRRALLQRPEGKRPPCIKLSPRKRIYDPDEFAAWIASLPRSR
jgi:hypothetical protein